MPKSGLDTAMDASAGAPAIADAGAGVDDASGASAPAGATAALSAGARSTRAERRAAVSTPRAAWLIGPALVAGVAYLDPGNVASNMTAGAQYGYLLVWIVVLGNVMAWLIQYLSAKLGVVTGESLPEVLGRRIKNKWGRRAYWLQAELVAMATDLAEVIGGAVALNLLFNVPLIWGGLITGAVSIALLMLQSRRGPRTFETVVIGLLVIITIGFTVGVFIAPPDPGALVGGLVPRFEDTGSVLLAASILGATIMPHAIYAHSALARDRFAPSAGRAGRTPRRRTADVAAPAAAPAVAGAPAAPTSVPLSQSATNWPFESQNVTGERENVGAAGERENVGAAGERDNVGAAGEQDNVGAATPTATIGASATLDERRGISTARLLRATRWDVSIAMAIAGTVNLCILLLAAVNLSGVAGTDSLEGAYAALRDSLGPVVATLFAVGLLASGLASSSVGAYAGAEIMHGLLRVRIPLLARRLVTLIPALVVLSLGIDPTLALVLSQVVLSFGIPFALIPLVSITAKAEVLGEWRNHWATTAAGIAASIFLITLNGVLLWLVLTGG